MGLETPTQPISIPNLVQPLTPVATPSAVQSLTDAFRSGFITSKEIIDHLGQVGQAKRKAELTTFQEAVSPDAVAARQATLQAASAVAGQKMLEAQEFASPEAVARRQAALKFADEKQQQDTANLYFEASRKAYAAAGNPPLKKVDPLTGEETDEPDFESEAEVGNRYIRADIAEKENAPLLVGKWSDEVSKDGKPIKVFRNTLGQDIGDGTSWRKHYEKLVQDARNIKYSVPKLPPPRPAKSGRVSPIVEPRQPIQDEPASTEIILPRETFVPDGTGIPVIAEEKIVPNEGLEKLVLVDQAIETTGRLQAAYEALIASDPAFLGMVAGRLATAADAKRWKKSISDFESANTALLAPIAKGTYGETGVLSKDDAERYKNVLPDLRDDPAVGRAKIASLVAEVAAARVRRIATWKMAGYKTSGFETVAPGGVATPGAVAPPDLSKEGKPIKLSDGTTMRWDAARQQFVR